jgi:DNA primase
LASNSVVEIGVFGNFRFRGPGKTLLMGAVVAQIPRESIEKVLEATDIVDLISSYIPVKRAGGGSFKANCPFHHEKTPSFTISPQRQTFHCFGCGKHGDAIGFVKDHENLSFGDAVRKLAQRAGVIIIEEASDPKAEMARKSKGRLMDLHREVAMFLHERLLADPDAGHARDYMKSRGFGKEMAVRWLVGWMPRNPRVFLDWARERNYKGRELVDSGLAGLKEEGDPRAGIYVRFTDRLMFPIRNEIGDVIAFSGRKLREDQPGGKYQNSPETAIFKKSNVLFALDRAKKAILKEKSALLCEGQLDTICCHEAGILEAIGTQGTALTTQHARILKRYSSHVVLCYDGDNSGVAATEKAFGVLAGEGLTARVVDLPKGDDPDSFLKAHGVDEFRQRIADAKEFFDWKLGRAKAEGALDSAAERTRVTSEAVALLLAMGDAAAREHQINVVAVYLGISAGSLREAIVKAKKFPQREPRAQGGESVETVEPTKLHRIVSTLCHLALSSGAAQHFLAEQFETLHEADRWVEGIPVLEKILAGAPDPSSPAALNAFMGGMSPADRMALSEEILDWDPNEQEGISGAEHALSSLSALVLQRRDAAVKAALKEPGLPAERLIALLEEAKEISSLMRAIGQRSEFDDQLPASTWKPKEPEWKRKWKK